MLLELELLVAELFKVELLRVLVEHLAVKQEDVGVPDVRDRDLLLVLDLELLCARSSAAESVKLSRRDRRERESAGELTRIRVEVTVADFLERDAEVRLLLLLDADRDGSGPL